MGRQVFDQIVIGAGGMGSAAIYELARRGQRVLGLEQFGIPHELGSSAGATRIFRFAYFEHPSYVPLMRLSFARWQALERDFGERLLTVTGGLDIGLPTGRVVRGAKEACRARAGARGAASERGCAALSGVAVAARVRSRLPARGGLSARRPGHRRARDAGAQARRGRARDRARARLEGDRRSRRGRDSGRAATRRAPLSWPPGPGRLSSSASSKTLAIPQRQVVGWFKTTPGGQFAPGPPFPCLSSIARREATSTAFQSRPTKASRSATSATAGRTSTPTPSTGAFRCRRGSSNLARALPFSSPMGPPVSFKTCMFVDSPDEHFIVDVLPGASQRRRRRGVIGTRLQVLLGNWRGPRRSVHAGGDRPRYAFVQPLAAGAA